MATTNSVQPARQSASVGTATKRLGLSDALIGSTNLPPRIIIHGRPAVGKTSAAVFAPNPFVIMSPGETGLHTLMDAGLLPDKIPNIEVADYNDVTGVIGDLRTIKHSRESLIIDTMNGVETLANLHVGATQYGGDMSEKGFQRFQSGYATVATGVWKQLLADLDALRRERKMLVVLLAHTAVANVKDPAGQDYTHYVPAFAGKATWQTTLQWADIVMMADFEIHTAKKDGDTKAKAFGGNRRFFRTSWSGAWDAKNRHNLPEEIEMGTSGQEAWNNLQAALAAGKRTPGANGNGTADSDK